MAKLLHNKKMTPFRTIAIFTGNRAEWGLLQPIAQALQAHPDFDLRLWVGGDHWGAGTVDEIKVTGFDELIALNQLSSEEWKALRKLPPAQRSLVVTQRHLADAETILKQGAPDFVMVLGDRVEAFAIAYAVFYHSPWLLHLAGGDWTEGGCPDDRLRFLISEVAHLHGTFSEQSAQRLLARGEEPWRVKVLGNPALDRLKQLELLPKATLCKEVGFDPTQPVALFTQHPVPGESEQTTLEAFQASLNALEKSGYQVVATYPNTDAHGDALYQLISRHKAKWLPGWHWAESLGQVRYFSWMAACDVVVGNSSSGLYETPLFKKASITVGPRQAGRERSTNVLAVPYGEEALSDALGKVLTDSSFQNQVQACVSPFGEGDCIPRLLDWLTKFNEGQEARQKRLSK